MHALAGHWVGRARPCLGSGVGFEGADDGKTPCGQSVIARLWWGGDWWVGFILVVAICF